MFCIVTNTGDYQELPHCRTLEEARIEFGLRYTAEEIEDLEAEIIEI